MKKNTFLNNIWIVISIIAISIAVISVYWAHTHKVKVMDVYNENEKLLSLIEKLMESERRQLKSEMPYILDEEVKNLQSKGLSDPVNDLVKDLQQYGNLIPFEGVHGGTMNFYDPQQIYILNAHWAVGYFEDGHYAGHALLKFDIIEQDSIEWTLFDAYLY